MKDRYEVKFSLSISEIRKIQKQIKEYQRIEIAKPYQWVLYLAKIGLYSLSIGGLFIIFIVLSLLMLSTDIDPEIARLQRMSWFGLALVVVALFAFFLSQKLENYFMKKYENKEQNDETYLRHIKINRYFIEFIQDNSSYKVFWPRVKKVKRDNELIFVQTSDNDFIIFPIRAVSSIEEFNQLYQFMSTQIKHHITQP